MLDEEVVKPHKYDKFLHSNGVPYAFLELPVAVLEQQMPDYANWAVEATDEEGNPTEIKTLSEYTLSKTFSIDKTKVVIALAAMQAETYRTPALTYNDLEDWEGWFDLLGYTIDNWLTIEERNTLLNSEVYNNDSE